MASLFGAAALDTSRVDAQIPSLADSGLVEKESGPIRAARIQAALYEHGERVSEKLVPGSFVFRYLSVAERVGFGAPYIVSNQ